MTNANKRANRLINEKSPYLLQHAYNPVDWYSWGDEAFDNAKKEDKPIFLSIGYSTCHWCHVMEKESFEDEEVAKILNENYICIKVDREERPDIDNIYMTFCQATMGHGGWPLSVFLTPEKQPFYAGTYFPRTSKYGQIGFIDLLNTITKKWKIQKDEIENSAKEMTNLINTIYSTNEEQEVKEDIYDRAYEYFTRNYDSKYGGFSKAPKFPTPHNMLFLLRYHMLNNNTSALEMVEKTLMGMYKGGIFDHIGFGFSRYSTDSKCLVPHFEKMLYDNALLLLTYIETYQLTKNNLYKEISEKIITYIINDMTTEEGAFLCAEDADSEGVEGKYYVWDKDEIINILGEEDGKVYCEYYNITERGNFEGKNIPNLIDSKIDEIERDIDLKLKLQQMSEKLYYEREKRIKPHKDDKILTSWNGLMIVALCKAGTVFNDIKYITYAIKAINFIEANLTREDGRLFSRFREGEAKHLAYIDDYAFLIWAYIELYEATFEPVYLKKANKLTNDMIKIFWDENSAGFFMYGSDSEELITRPKEIYDGAIPSGNSVAAYDLLRLSKITGNMELEEKAYKLFKYFGTKINEAPMAHSFMLLSKIFADNPTREIVLTSSSKSNDINDYLDIVNDRFLPFTIVILNREGKNISDINEFVKNYESIDGKTTAYICENFSCQKPVVNIDKFREIINS